MVVERLRRRHSVGRSLSRLRCAPLGCRAASNSYRGYACAETECMGASSEQAIDVCFSVATLKNLEKNFVDDSLYRRPTTLVFHVYWPGQQRTVYTAVCVRCGSQRAAHARTHSRTLTEACSRSSGARAAADTELPPPRRLASRERSATTSATY